MNLIHVTMRNIASWIRFWSLVGYVVAVPLEYNLDDWDRELSYDFDTEQSEVRYDPKLLSEELEDTLTKRRGAACNISNIIYEHGEQVARNDPCEVCVCMDGEIFCYWRQCSGEIGDNMNYGSKEVENEESDVFSPYWKLKRPSPGSMHTQANNHLAAAKLTQIKKLLKSTKNPWTTKPTAPATILPKPTKIIKTKKLHKTKKLLKRPRKPTRKRMKLKKVFSFPEHLPATLHFDIENAKRTEFEVESDESIDETPGSVKDKVTAFMTSDTSTSTTSSENIHSNKNQSQQGANNVPLPQQLQSTERNISQNDPDTNGWQGFSLNISQSTIALSSPSLLPSSQTSPETMMTTTTITTTPTITSTAAPVMWNGSNNDDKGSSGMPSKHINFQSGGIIPNDVSIDSEDDSDDNENDSGATGESSLRDKKTVAEKMRGGDSGGPENRRIQFVDVPMAKHYIITSSGSVENADVLASENVLSQFRNDFGVANGDPTGNAVPMLPLAPAALPAPQPPLPQLDTSTGGIVSETASLEKTSAAIISNDGVQSSVATIAVASRPDTRMVSSEGVASASTADTETGQSNATPSLTYVAAGKASSEVSIFAALQQSSIPATSVVSSSEAGQQRDKPSVQQPEAAPSTVQPPRQQHDCVVMGSSYQVGTILPQETGNCLQCVCAEGSNSNDPPRVTCSPHNCPPLVLPDLFDTTGY